MTAKEGIEPDAIFARGEGVLLREIDGELLLLNSSSDSYFSLNRSGAAMYQNLENGATVSATVEAVAETFEAPRELVEQDLNVLLGELLERGLMTRQV